MCASFCSTISHEPGFNKLPRSPLPPAMAGLADLPGEILLHILSCKYNRSLTSTTNHQHAKLN